jgi:hypothetical protein
MKSTDKQQQEKRQTRSPYQTQAAPLSFSGSFQLFRSQNTTTARETPHFKSGMVQGACPSLVHAIPGWKYLEHIIIKQGSVKPHVHLMDPSELTQA